MLFKGVIFWYLLENISSQPNIVTENDGDWKHASLKNDRKDNWACPYFKILSACTATGL